MDSYVSLNDEIFPTHTGRLVVNHGFRPPRLRIRPVLIDAVIDDAAQQGYFNSIIPPVGASEHGRNDSSR